MDVGELYQILANHGVETYNLAKGTAPLAKQHLENTHRETETQYNFNILGLARSLIPQYSKEGRIKGATITLITNGGVCVCF